MALSSNIIGMHYRYPDYYEVGREKIREYAVAVKNDDAAYFTTRPPPRISATRRCRRR